MGCYLASGVPASALAGKNLRRALIEIANQSDGSLRIATAIPILQGAGIVRPARRNARAAIYNKLIRCREFERAGPGEFKLVLQPRHQTPIVEQISDRR